MQRLRFAAYRHIFNLVCEFLRKVGLPTHDATFNVIRQVCGNFFADPVVKYTFGGNQKRGVYFTGLVQGPHRIDSDL